MRLRGFPQNDIFLAHCAAGSRMAIPTGGDAAALGSASIYSFHDRSIALCHPLRPSSPAPPAVRRRRLAEKSLEGQAQHGAKTLLHGLYKHT
ncbi:hypothetical protein BRADI_4g22615v3 [Brachypodium distachyon]|uniref:Uncharacterized protein n=1 Tax=Brachypodium distachyon TaxID=15368 RepID=A0A2K2CPJ4_BRADI|nr:hypothetical protein BRADI_4g22615v3 [Brachypodium distachyon]